MKLAQCKKELELKKIELGIYHEIGGAAVRRAGAGAILGRLLGLALKALKCSSGTIYLFDERKKELTFQIVKGPMSRRFKGLKMQATKGIAGRVATSRRPYLSNDLVKDKYWIGLKSGNAHKSCLAVPLGIKKRLIGVLQVFDRSGGRPFQREDTELLCSIANHLAMIIQSRSLFSDLDSRVKEFKTLHGLGALLTSSLDQKVVRHRAMEAITKLMRAETGSLLMVDEKTDELYFEVALGDAGATIKEIRLKMGEGIAGWVASSGKPLIVPDVLKDKRFQGKVDKKSKFRTRNMICVPVIIKDRVIGVLQAINRLNHGAFTREDLKLFQLFSNQVAIALDNARLYGQIKETFYATSEALAEAIEKRDPYTGGHTKRVLEYCLAIAKHMSPAPDNELLKLSAVLHDIGKIGVEDRILRKQAPLDAEEAAQMRQHPAMGVSILQHVPQLKEVIPGMLYHHEKPDGKGYPEGLKDDEIPMTAKIIAVADTYDAMTTNRPYRKGLSDEVALGELKKFSGTQFDAVVVDAFFKAFELNEVQAIRNHASGGITITPEATKAP